MRNRDLGDFQTPVPLARLVLASLGPIGEQWARVLEPTCGCGNFIAALLSIATPPKEVIGIEIQPDYVERARWVAESSVGARVLIERGSIFERDLRRELRWMESGPLLVVGNPPWVTNSQLGALESNNLPRKWNLRGLRGLDAQTGCSNFDIAEAVWIKLIRELLAARPTIALLCKLSVARSVSTFLVDAGIPFANAAIRRIDARRWFGAAVDACLFRIDIGRGTAPYEVTVYPDLQAQEPESVMGFVNRRLIPNVRRYNPAFDGTSSLIWRQGMKHDAASVMELMRDENGFLRNRSGDVVDIEPGYVYPLVKGVDLFHGVHPMPRRFVIVTQTSLSENTGALRVKAPKLWHYLSNHLATFERRKSAVYRGRPRFAVFGVGDYSFTSYKIGVSGLHRRPIFRAIGPIEGLPAILDDTCYFLACDSPEQAALLASLLNHPICHEFLQSTMFPDAKRPITKSLLQRINLHRLLTAVNREDLLSRADAERTRLGAVPQQERWPEELSPYLLSTERQGVLGIPASV